MAIVSTPYGLRPVSLVGGRSFAGSTRLIKMTNSYGTNVFYGDAVGVVAAGTVERVAGGAAMSVVGIFMGCTYTDPGTSQKVFKQYWPASTVATDNYAYVCDDPGAVFQVQSSGAVTQAALGGNAALVDNAGSTTTGNSRVQVATTFTNTATLPVKLIGFVDGPTSAIGDTFTDCLVIWNSSAAHQYLNTTGLA